MNIYAISGLLVTIAVITCAILLGSPLFIFLDLPSSMIVLGGTFFVILATHGPAGPFTYVLGGLQRIFFPSTTAPWSADECRMAAYVAKTGGTAAIMMAACGAMIGLTQMFTNMEDPASIGPAMAVCLLTSFYAILLNLLIFVPLYRSYSESTDTLTTAERT